MYDKPLPSMPPERDNSQDQQRADSPVLGSFAEQEPLDRAPDMHNIDLEYLRAHPSAALPPSPFSFEGAGMNARPRAPTPSATPPPVSDDAWSPAYVQRFSPQSPQSSYLIMESPISVVSPTSPSTALPHRPHSPLVRPASYYDDSFVLDVHSARSFALPAKLPQLPDPSQFPDPYPFRRPNPTLNSSSHCFSSGGSSSASTRSSAYTSGSALASSEHEHAFMGSDTDDTSIGVSLTKEDDIQVTRDTSSSTSSSAQQSNPTSDQRPWSFTGSIRSRSSSVGNTNTSLPHENGPLRSQGEHSFDSSWQVVDERDEFGLSSDDDTDDDDGIDVEEQDEDEQREDGPTAAVVVVEEGRGLIVQGEGRSVAELQAQPGTTHLLLGSSGTPNAVPSFLAYLLPQISSSLLVLDISANFLGALPPALSSCVNLEELNVASNPLRALPVFLAQLTSLRVLIADSTGITTLPTPLSALEKLHTLSVRRNKLNSLPSWFCLLPSLETLLLEGNPFQGPWRALIDPLLVKTPMAAPYPPSTPMFPLPSASIQSSTTDTETDVDDLSDPSSPGQDAKLSLWTEDEDTITPARAPLLTRHPTSPSPADSSSISFAGRGLTRTRTTPNKAHYDKRRPSTAYSASKSKGSVAARQSSSKQVTDSGYYSGYFGDRDLRKMKSAGDLHRGTEPLSPALLSAPPSATSPPPQLMHAMSSSNLLNDNAPEAGPSVLPKRYASLGVASGPHAGTSPRPKLSNALWDNISVEEDEDSLNSASRFSFADKRPTSPTTRRGSDGKSIYFEGGPHNHDIHHPVRVRPPKDDKEKNGRWGFLKKMSMGKIRPDSPASSRASSRPTTAQGRPPATPFAASALHARLVPITMTSVSTPGTPRISTIDQTPQIDLRISTTGALDSPDDALLTLSPPHSEANEKLGPDITNITQPVSLALPPPSSNLLTPTSPGSKSAKRRSFLPIDGSSASLNIPIPPVSPFIPGLTATNGADDSEPQELSLNAEYLQRRGDEWARDAYIRALRSVMAYLKDMQDLGPSQGSVLSMYESVTMDAGVNAGSRRPTLVDGARVKSEGSITSTSSMSSSQLRSVESLSVLRSGSAAQTMSVATTDSGGSASGSDERKFKDDKGKRAMIVREILETERTYVKGLQELVDIYIKPASAPANVLSGVGSNKETVVPPAERKIVFSGLEALFSFHKESFLPALERAAAPLMGRSALVADADADGQMSSDVARAVADIFDSHAAFMKMYSSYINNFDNSVQRIKSWSSSRTASSPGSAMSPSSSAAQIVGLGLTISAISNPGVVAEGSLNGAGSLSTSQRKRIKTFLKRCRIHPRHSQLNLEGYLLLPVQRIPRYRLLLEELAKSTAPVNDYIDDPLDRALAKISSLATSMNEGKRESESRRKLVQWQARIRGKFPSPLVQPHRRLIMDGPLQLTRVVRKQTMPFETIDSHGDSSTVQVECLMPELTPRSLTGILCNDLLVLCRDPSEGRDPNCHVDLWAVLRMQTLPQPCTIVHGNALRIVDNKAILYFDVSTSSDALNWFRAINLHIPASKA